MSSLHVNLVPFLELSVAYMAECRLSCIKVSVTVMPRQVRRYRDSRLWSRGVSHLWVHVGLLALLKTQNMPGLVLLVDASSDVCYLRVELVTH